MLALAAGAATVQERLAAGWTPADDPAVTPRGEEIFALWAERSARGDAAGLARRLAWDGLDPAAVRRALTPGHLSPAPLPAWTATFREVSALAAGARSVDASWRDPERPIPFEEILAPWVAAARRRCGGAELAPEAWRDLERWLATRLSALAAEALGAAFDRFRGGRPDSFAVRLAEAGVGRETRLHVAFVDNLLSDGLTAWAAEFPALARLLATVTDLWAGHCRDLLAHWREDAATVQTEILGLPAGPGLPVPRILRIAAGLSDAHNGGRTTHILTLEGGARAVYKSRSLGADLAFARWLAWCNARGAAHGLLGHTLHRLLDRGDRGWAELVTTEPCADREAARRFHVRAGQLLALLHASGARDAHYENLMAHGEHPVLIDLEAWLPPRLARWLPAPGDEGWADAALRLEHSVLSTGLLPRWQPDGVRDDVVNVGGLGGGQPGTRLQPVWHAVGTDRMIRAWSPVASGVQPNVPVLGGQPLAPAAWAREVRAGFVTMYRFLVAHREELLAADGPLGDLAGRRGRLIFRPTRAYSRLRDRSLRPDACRDAAIRGGELEALTRVYLDAPGSAVPATWPLFAAERRALEQGDIPYFHADLAGTVLEGPDGTKIPGVIARPAIEGLRERLRRLGPEDLAAQVAFIDAALAPVPPSPDSSAEVEDTAPQAGPSGPRGTLAGDGGLDLAVPLALTLRDRAFRGPGGSLAWIGPRYLAGGETFELSPLGTDLYGGTGGIALFFAALEGPAGGGWGDLALRLALHGTAPGPEGIGGLVGLGSRIYTLVAIGHLLDAAEPIREAHRLAARITPERIAADTRLDVTLGAAGALLALLALDAARPTGSAGGPDPLELAAACARHLLARRLPGTGAWASPGRPPESGFAHGAAGIAYALLRFAARTGDREAREAACRAIAFERRLLAAEGAVQTTWCRGIPGVALARLGALDTCDDAATRAEIDAALALTRSPDLTPMDHLCCGNLGRAEILLEAGEILGDAAPAAAARELAGRVLARAAARGGLSWLPSGEISSFDPSFFKGAAGVGYTLLRLAAPERLPCVLRLEAPCRKLREAPGSPAGPLQ
jgi:type 2 lantibiotic biosynthesis protein LanM